MSSGRRHLTPLTVVIDQKLSCDIEVIFVQNSKRLKSDDVSEWPLPNKIPGSATAKKRLRRFGKHQRSHFLFLSKSWLLGDFNRNCLITEELGAVLSAVLVWHWTCYSEAVHFLRLSWLSETCSWLLWSFQLIGGMIKKRTRNRVLLD